MNITINKIAEENHPWNFYIPADADKLMIGTFPTEARNRKYDFFYCSATNRFWQITSEIVGQQQAFNNGDDPIALRKEVLRKLKLGLTDMGKKVLRQLGSSKDHSLFPIEFTDIIDLLLKHPKIKTIIVSGSEHGNSSLSWLNIYCTLNKIYVDLKKLKREKSIEVKIAGRMISIKISYSTSRLSRVHQDALVDSFRSIF